MLPQNPTKHAQQQKCIQPAAAALSAAVTTASMLALLPVHTCVPRPRACPDHSSPPSSWGASSLMRSSMRRMVSAASVANCRTAAATATATALAAATAADNDMSGGCGKQSLEQRADDTACPDQPWRPLRSADSRMAQSRSCSNQHHHTGNLLSPVPQPPVACLRRREVVYLSATHCCGAQSSLPVPLAPPGTHLDHLGFAQCWLQHTRLNVVDHLHAADTQWQVAVTSVDDECCWV